MRMRKKKHGSERISMLSELLITEERAAPGSNVNFFPDTAPLHLEIGCGKGRFICGMAQKYPNVNFIAIERIPDVIVCAMEKCGSASLKNIRFIIGDASHLPVFFAPGEVSRIYLNFSDPWPKKKHHKRRLTAPIFLSIYKTLLCPDGSIVLKTDNRELFEFSLEEFQKADFRLDAVTYDLHNSVYKDNNIMTEYEQNFASKGLPIHSVTAYRD